MIDALTATALAARRELPAPIRGLLLAMACACLQLGIDRREPRLAVHPAARAGRLAAPGARPAARGRRSAAPDRGHLAAPAPPAAVYKSPGGVALAHAARSAGEASLVLCAVVFVLATLLAWADQLGRGPTLSRTRRRRLADRRDRDRRCRRLRRRTRGHQGASVRLHQPAMERVRPRLHGDRFYQQLRGGRQRPLRLLAGRHRRLPGPPDRGPRTGQLRQLLRRPPPDQPGAGLDPQPRDEVAGAHWDRRLRVVLGVHRGGGCGRAPGPPPDGDAAI